MNGFEIRDKILNLNDEELLNFTIQNFSYEDLLYNKFLSLVNLRNIINRNIKRNNRTFGRDKFQIIYKYVKEDIYRKFNLTCSICGFKNGNGIKDKPMHIDHIVPIKYGGSNDISNLQLLCSDCNLKKGSKI